jgi:hypothetical protein
MEFKKKIDFRGTILNGKLGVLHWKDACVWVKADGILTSMPDCIAIGYVCQDKEKYIVVSGFTRGVPDEFILIPKQWTISIYYLRR